MSIQDPGRRPGKWEVAGDQDLRIRKLEAVPPPVWVGEDCCLYWRCPTDGLLYRFCGVIGHGWIYQPMPVPYGAHPCMEAVNESNIAVGNSAYVASSFVANVAYHWDIDTNVATPLTPLAGYTGCFVRDINEDGVMAGYSWKHRSIGVGVDEITATKWADPSTPSAVGAAYSDPPDVNQGGLVFGSDATAINDSGLVAGNIYDPQYVVGGGSGPYPSTPWINTTTIPALAGDTRGLQGTKQAVLTGLNNSGNACGSIQNEGFTAGGSWFYDGVATTIDTGQMVAHAIDDDDVVYLIDNQVTPADIYTWASGPGLTLIATEAFEASPLSGDIGVNGAGDIVWGTYASFAAVSIAGGFVANPSLFPFGANIDLPAGFSATTLNTSGIVVGETGSSIGAMIPF